MDGRGICAGSSGRCFGDGEWWRFRYNGADGSWIGRKAVLLKAPKQFDIAPRCAFRLRGCDRMIFDFAKSKTSAASAGRSRRSALRAAPRILGGRAITGPPRYRSHRSLNIIRPPLFHEFHGGAAVDGFRRCWLCAVSDGLGNGLRRLKGPVP